jgi:polar amino acid transport system permease protein
MKGTLVTIKITFFSLGLGLVLAIPIAFGQVYGNKLIKLFISFYEKVLRSIPLLVILFLIFYGFPGIGIKIPAFTAAVIGIGIRSSAYQSQVFRGAIQSVSGSQLKAALSMGMNSMQAFVNIILPQAVRIAIPPLTNESAIVLKDTSLAYALGVIDLVRHGGYIISTTYRPLPIYITVAIIYLIMTLTINMSLAKFEKKLKIPGIGIEERAR